MLLSDPIGVCPCRCERLTRPIDGHADVEARERHLLLAGSMHQSFLSSLLIPRLEPVQVHKRLTHISLRPSNIHSKAEKNIDRFLCLEPGREDDARTCPELSSPFLNGVHAIGNSRERG